MKDRDVVQEVLEDIVLLNLRVKEDQTLLLLVAVLDFKDCIEGTGSFALRDYLVVLLDHR